MLEVVAQIPVSSKLVPGFLEHVINKKVAKAALNVFEKFADWLLTWIYYPYQELCLAKLSRIHLFNDGTPLFDCTKEGIAAVQQGSKNGFLTVLGKQVAFSFNCNVKIAFSQECRTEYVAVQDDRGRCGWIQIIEQEKPLSNHSKPMEKMWLVNTNKAHQFVDMPDSKPFYVANHPMACSDKSEFL